MRIIVNALVYRKFYKNWAYKISNYKKYNRGYSSRSYNPGYERARQHIQEAAELSRELGGIDKEIKQFFFQMPPDELKLFFDAYEKVHGLQRREYAAEAHIKWKSGQTKMSGMVASRIIDLLPPFMPVDLKLQLVEKFWLNSQNYKEIYLLAPQGTESAVISTYLREHYAPVIENLKIPDNMKKRFRWLAAQDAAIVERLISEVKAVEANRSIDYSAAAISRLIERVDSNSDIIHAGVNTFKVGNNNIHFKYSEYVDDITEVDNNKFQTGNKPPPQPTLADQAMDKFGGWLIVGGIILFVLWMAN